MVGRLSALIRLMVLESSLFALKVKSILIHICVFWEAFLAHIFLRQICVLKSFYYGVSFVRTRIETFYRILKRFATFLHPRNTH